MHFRYIRISIHKSRWHLLILAFIFIGLPMVAQSASVDGQVIDPSGALVRGAQITQIGRAHV